MTPAEIALEQANALVNATAVEPDAQRREAMADRIGELLQNYNTAEIALAQAQALFNAAVVEPDARRREALADRIGELLQNYNTAEIALEQAKALLSAGYAVPLWRLPRRLALKFRAASIATHYGVGDELLASRTSSKERKARGAIL